MRPTRISAATEALREGLANSFVVYVSGLSPPFVVFLGHSYICWAAQRAGARPGSRSLGFNNIIPRWCGLWGLRWYQLLSKALEISCIARPPVILIIHTGGNDLCAMRLSELLVLMRADLDRIFVFFPILLLVWSAGYLARG